MAPNLEPTILKKVKREREKKWTFQRGFSFQVFALSKEQMQSLLASYGGQRRRDLSLADWPALHEKYLAPWLVKETGE